MLHCWVINLPSRAMSRITRISDLELPEVSAPRKHVESHGLLHEMMKSFTTLARTLNLSHAVKELGSTRQTVRRHITLLEEAKGEPLFSVEDRQYRLTEAGERALPEALEILARGNAWLYGQSQQIERLQYLRHNESEDWFFYQQQKPIGLIFSASSPMLNDVFQAWAISGGDLEHEAMLKVRTFCNIFRRLEGNWVFTEVGDESSFVSWFGMTRALSTVGRAMGQMPGGDEFGRLVNVAHAEVEATQSVRLDHVFTLLPKEGSQKPVPICYERLLLGGSFADRSFAMISVVRRTYDVHIEGVSQERLREMPEDMTM